MIRTLFIASERVEHGDHRKTKIHGTQSLATREVDSKRASFSPEHDLRGPLCDTRSSHWKLEGLPHCPGDGLASRVAVFPPAMFFSQFRVNIGMQRSTDISLTVIKYQICGKFIFPRLGAGFAKCRKSSLSQGCCGDKARQPVWCLRWTFP